MTEVMDQIIDIHQVDYIEKYKLKITFSDGKEQMVDFGPFLKKSKHPDIQKYLEIEKFKKFSIIAGNLDWNDYELCFPTIDLYRGQI